MASQRGRAIPDWLLPLRARLPELADAAPEDYVEVLLTEYQSGAGIGWHRDARAFGAVVGVSLLGECRMRLREFPENEATGQTGKKRSKSVLQVLEPRSAYVLQGAARSLWQHSIPSTESLRYSITFRTLRAGGKRKGE